MLKVEFRAPNQTNSGIFLRTPAVPTSPTGDCYEANIADPSVSPFPTGSLVGHGVGRSYHEDPQVPNFGPPGRGPALAEGMTIAIEPMITAGRPDVYVHDDGWSISTVDGSLSAHFEHTVAVTASGPRILTTSAVPLLR